MYDGHDQPAPTAPKRGSNLDDLRRGNLSTVLELIHSSRSLSRADITRATGLNRSTVATIVTELETLGLVTVSEPADTKRIGRPSSVITPSDRFLAIAVNPELDALTIGLVGMGGRVLRIVRYENEREPTPTEMVKVAAAVLGGMLPSLEPEHRIVGVGLAVPGLVNAADGVVKLAPHLAWTDVPLAGMLAEAVDQPVSAGNDASCGVIAEAAFGAGIGEREIVYLNGGASGIGGGIVVGGEHLGGADGYGGELGHTLVESNGRACHCGAVGCLETEVDRSRLMAVAGAADPARLDELLEAAYETSAEARDEVHRQVDYLAVALRNIVNALNPRLVILGGFLATLQRVGGERLEQRVRATALPGSGTDVRIVASSLGRDNLLIGAAELAFASILADPAAFARSRAVVAAVGS
ncbi:ROK family protein [Microbacterium sp. NPDC058389]|uniref:ROK family transcriptional regulator n=1 Tax=Microbacterium sp. NPDC058389 TaxID=3346475 RepID=UPI00365B9A13